MLNTYVKPAVVFDVNNKEHRKAYYKFFKKQAWGKSPRFVLEWPHPDIPSMIQHKLMNHYLKNDFKATKPIKVAKPKKTIPIKEIK
jgi:hypothetical protein